MTKKNNWQLIIQTLTLVSQLGITVISAIAVAFFIGQALDRLLGYSFLLTPIFIVLGVVTGFWSVYRLVESYLTRQKKDD